MKITKSQKLILYSLGKFYRQLNQPLEEKPVKLQTSKIVFIELLVLSEIVSKQRRALYKNLEMLEKKGLIMYENRMISFTKEGLDILSKINSEIEQFVKIKEYFSHVKKPRRKLQTVIK